MRKIEKNGIMITLDEQTLSVSMKRGETTWSWKEEFQPKLICAEGEFLFADAVNISSENYSMGIGQGIRTRFEGFEKEGEGVMYRRFCGPERWRLKRQKKAGIHCLRISREY